MKNKAKPFLFLNVLIYFIFMILHPRVSMYTEIAVGLLLVVLIVAMMYGVFHATRVNILIFCLVLYYFFQATISGGVVAGLSYSLSFLVTLSPLLLADLFFLSDVFTRREKKIFIFVISICFIYCIVSSLIYLNTNSMAVREMASASGEISFSLQGIGGGYVLLFALVAFAPLFIYCFKVFEKIYVKIISLFIWMTIEYFIFKCDVTIAFVLSLIFSFITLFIGNRKKFIIGSACVFLFLISAFLIIKNSVADFSLSAFNGTYIGIRLTSLFEGDVTAGGRMQLISKSTEAIINYPLFGAGVKYGFNYYDINRVVGNHSDFFDIPAKLGIPFAIIFLLVFVSMSKKLIDTFDSCNKKHLFIILLMMMLIASILDPILTTNMLMSIFVFIPLFFNFFDSLNTNLFRRSQFVYN